MIGKGNEAKVLGKDGGLEEEKRMKFIKYLFN
jgi:hypothetical protein